MKLIVKHLSRILMITILIISLGGCSLIFPVNPNQRIKPTIPLKLADHLVDKVIFQQKETFMINGTSENGALIEVKIYDNRRSVYKKASTIVNEDGIFQLSFTAPKASYQYYQIEIFDGVNSITLNEVLFGEVWMVLGERYQLTTNQIEDELTHLGFYQDGQWIYLNTESVEMIPELGLELGIDLLDQLDIPVGIILSVTDQAHFDAWLSKEKIDLHPRLTDFIVETDRYINADPIITIDDDQMSAMYEKTLRPLEYYKIKGSVIKIGETDYQNFNTLIDGFESKIQNGLQMLTDFLSNQFSQTSLFFLQSENTETDYFFDLRLTQATATYNNSKAGVVVIYDLEKAEVIDQFEEVSYQYQPLAISDLVDRLIYMIINQTYYGRADYKCVAYTNYIVTKNTIAIEFHNAYGITNVDQILGFEITDQLGQEIEYSFRIDQNWLLIELVIDKEIDQSLITVSYGFNQDWFMGNLFNSRNLPIVPFIITFRG